MTASAPVGRSLDAGLHLLDRQVLDRDGREVGKVDDVEVEVPADGGEPIVTALLCGPLAFGPRLGGRLGAWVVAIGRRLRGPDYEGDPNEPVRIPFEVVKRVHTAVELTVDRSETGALALDHWVRRHVIERIPGASERPPEERDAEADANAETRGTPSRAQLDDAEAAADRPTTRLSTFFDVPVHDADGRAIGPVHDVCLVQDGPPVDSFGARLRVHGVLAGSGSVWARLGFDRDRVQGPWLLKFLARRAARHTTFVPWDERLARELGPAASKGEGT